MGRGGFDPARAEEVGFKTGGNAYYLQVDQNCFKYATRLSGVEIMTVRESVESKLDEARDYWRLKDPGKDEYTGTAALLEKGG